MRILGVSAGTKNGGNDAMCKEALRGALEAGADVQFVNVHELEIKHCTGCVACSNAIFKTGKKVCTLKDDFMWLVEQMLQADGVIFSSPIFEKGAPGIFHTITDRFGSSTDRGILTVATDIANKLGNTPPDQRWLEDKVVSYMGCGGSDWTTKIQCDHAMQAMSPAWKVIDNEVFPWSLGIIGDDEKLARAHQIGINLANAAADIPNAKYMGEPGVCPHCHGREFYFHKDGVVECCLCGIRGKMVPDGDLYKFEFDESELEHAHDMLPGKFAHADDINVNNTRANEYRTTDAYKARLQEYKDFIQSSKPGNEIIVKA